MADVSIRPATHDDLPALRALWLGFETWLGSIGATDPIDPAKFDAFEDLAFGPAPLCQVLIAEVDGEAVGYLVYQIGVWIDDMAPALFVADLYVEDRGQGIGTALMQRAREIADDRDAKHVFWTVWRENAAAQTFYRGLGAEVFDEEVFMRWRVR